MKHVIDLADREPDRLSPAYTFAYMGLTRLQVVEIILDTETALNVSGLEDDAADSASTPDELADVFCEKTRYRNYDLKARWMKLEGALDFLKAGLSLKAAFVRWRKRER